MWGSEPRRAPMPRATAEEAVPHSHIRTGEDHLWVGTRGQEIKDTPAPLQGMLPPPVGQLEASDQPQTERGKPPQGRQHPSSQMSAMGGGQEMIPRAPALLPLAPGKEPAFAHKEGIPPPADIPRGPAGERASWGRKASPRVSRCTRRSGLWAHKEPPPSLPS